MTNINYKELVNKYLTEYVVPPFKLYAETIDENYEDGEDNDGSIRVFVNQLVSAHYGDTIPFEFCRYIGIFHEASDDADEVKWDFDKLREEYENWLDAHKTRAFSEGNFSIEYNDDDGSLCLYYVMSKKELNFSKWRRSEGYVSWDSFYNDGLMDDRDADELKEEYDEIRDEFEDYCDNNHYEAVFDED